MIKFLDLVAACKEVNIDCDRCKYQKECAKVAEHLEDASPIAIAALVQENKEF
jgi:hypothetical protein